MNHIAINLGEKLFGGANVHPSQEVSGLGILVSVFVSNAIIVAGVIFIFMGLYAGFQILTSAGQRSPQNMEAASKTLTTAIAGFLLVFASFLIIRIIEQITALSIL
jgi:hypothetical protein